MRKIAIAKIDLRQRVKKSIRAIISLLGGMIIFWALTIFFALQSFRILSVFLYIVDLDLMIFTFPYEVLLRYVTYPYEVLLCYFIITTITGPVAIVFTILYLVKRHRLKKQTRLNREGKA